MEAHKLGARTDRIRQTLRLGGDKDETDWSLRFFDGFQKRIGRFQAHAVGLIDDHDAVATVARRAGETAAQIADLFDLDAAAIRRDLVQIGMGACSDLAAGETASTAVGVCRRFAQEQRRQRLGRRPLADAIRSVKDIRMTETTVGVGALQLNSGAVLADDVAESHLSHNPPCISTRGAEWLLPII